MHTDTVSIDQFVSNNRIVSGAFRVDSNPSMPNSANMDHWKVTLVRGVLREGYDTWHGYKGKLGACRYTQRKLTVYFSMGYGHHGAEPKTAEVLSCIASDSSTADDHSFEDFCSEFGYDTDSRTAERIYKSCQHTAKRLLNFLGSDLYGQLLYSTERL